MANAAPKKRPMRSKRSGVKKLALVKSNLSILKKLAALFIIVFLFACEAPYHITETYTTDSTGKTVRTVQKYYNNTTTVTPQASINIGSSFWWGTPYYYRPYYNPVIVPRIVVPVNPSIHYNQAPRYIPRGGRH